MIVVNQVKISEYPTSLSLMVYFNNQKEGIGIVYSRFSFSIARWEQWSLQLPEIATYMCFGNQYKQTTAEWEMIQMLGNLSEDEMVVCRFLGRFFEEHMNIPSLDVDFVKYWLMETGKGHGIQIGSFDIFRTLR